MKILILMAIWSQNLWDELILKNEIKLLEQKYAPEKIDFEVCTYDLEDDFIQKENVKYLEYFPIWIKNPKNFFRNIKNFKNFLKSVKKADKIVFWWGWIFFDNEIWSVTNPLNQWLFRRNIARFFKKDVIFWWVSIDVKLDENILKVKKIFQNSHLIYVRDKASVDFLEKLWINSTQINDPVFYDNWNYPEKNSMIAKIDSINFSLDDINDIDFNWKKVWLALRKGYLWLNTWVWESDLIKEFINYIIKNNWKVILISHSFHKLDKNSNDYEFLKDFVIPWVEITKNMVESYEVYKSKKIDICFSMRLHSVILSQVYGMEFINLKYAKKWDLI